MPGFLEPIWETVFKIATWSALVFGTLSIGSAFVSAWIGWEITDATQKEADTKIKAADVRIAEANARALEAQVALEKFKAPRILTAEQQQNVVAAVKPWAGLSVSFSVTSEPESIALMQVVRRTLGSAGWVPIASQMGDLEIDGAGVATASGIEVQVHPLSARGTKLAGAAQALAQALMAADIAAIATANPQLKNESAVNVMVGKKP
jgi:hypothetical protein